MEALHDILCGILQEFLPEDEPMEGHCCFEPPDGMQLCYPCIIYNHANDDDDFADNVHYRCSKRYVVTIIDADPDSKIPEKLKGLNYCTSDRIYDSYGLCHFVHTLFYNGPRIKEVNSDG